MKAIPRPLLNYLSRMARPYLRSYGLLETAKIFNRSAMLYTPSNEKVVVLAPHMDDEVIGCGGSLAQHVTRGGQVTVIFFTDGRDGGRIPDGEADVTPSRDSLSRIRKSEARAALATLGIADAIFLDGVDCQVLSSPGLGERLREHLLAIQPDLVYLPFFLEEHPDHRAISHLLLAAAQGTRLSFRCHGYEVWTPLFPNCLVNIDDTIEQKRQAIAHYRSQTADSDYVHTAFGLNAYRSGALLGPCRYAEAFCALSLPDYLQLFGSYIHP
jgi:LmbE family N-acetylglucosaminyl deacetylase